MRHWEGAVSKFGPVGGVEVEGEVEAGPSRSAAGGADGRAGIAPVVDQSGGKVCAFEGCSAVFPPARNRRYCVKHSPADTRELARRAAGEAWAEAERVFDRAIWLGGDSEGGFGWWQTSEPEGWVPLPESALFKAVEGACGGSERVAGAALRGVWPAVMKARLTPSALQNSAAPGCGAGRLAGRGRFPGGCSRGSGGLTV